MIMTLGEFELLVLLAVLQVGEDANGAAILRELHDRAGRNVARGALYVTLERLEAKGLLASTTERGPSPRGGRPRRFYRVRAAGRQALRTSLEALARMQRGLHLDLKVR
jgi:PadR family transcriptional regulator, regulatory protein PadR